MNAKKIMGAVLVALLAAALFVGAGAATSVNGQTVFVYEVVTDSNIQGTWANGANTITFEPVTGGWAIMGADIVEGTYKKGSDSIIVKYATAAITGKGTYGTSPVINYGVIDGTYYNVTGSSLTIETSSADGIVVIGADGIPVPMNSPITTLTEGTYKLQAYFKISGGVVTFVETTPADYVYDNTVGSILLGKAAYTITVVDGADPTITAAVDSVVESSTVDVTLTGLPGVVYNISAPGFSIPNHATVSVTAGNDELTGIFVTSDGYIVTGGAPCLDAENVYVQIAGEKLEANVLGVNKNRNIAVLKVDSKSHTAADFGYGERINIGDEVFVAYNCANGHKVLKGSISVVEGGSVSVSGIGFENVMHGAAVIDGNGRVIGIVTHGNSGSLCAVSSSFAISTIRQFVKDAIQISSSENKKIEWLGVSVIQVTDDESKRFGLPGGVMILKTERLSLAEHIGLLPNDIIIGAESFAVNSVEKLDDIVSRYNGKTVSLLVYRNERYININLDVDN